MAFLSLTLDNIKTQQVVSTTNTNGINTSTVSSPILNFNNDLYSIENNIEKTTPDQIKEKYQDKKYYTNNCKCVYK